MIEFTFRHTEPRIVLQAGHSIGSLLYQLGKLYLTNENIPKDVIRAVDYLTGAAEQDNQQAQYILGKPYLLSIRIRRGQSNGSPR